MFAFALRQVTQGFRYTAHHWMYRVYITQVGESLVIIRTGDGRNPKQPPGMYKTLQIMG